MNTPYDIIKHIARTEKGSGMMAENKYIFHVANDANKIQIKQAVEKIYNVTVKKATFAFVLLNCISLGKK